MLMYWGETAERWCPAGFLSSRHPDVRVYEVDLPGRLLGCIDHDQRIIWLRAGLSDVVRRCTLAYEAAQLEQGPTPEDPCLAAAHQRAATEWAAQMLIPSEMFAAAWADCLDLATMAAFCEVDLAMFRARMRAASDADQDAAIDAIAATRLSA